ncbi:hypothetical protein M440DRAFT_1057724 [Trichoderma longibrachiatum ATCC 18648]|uniref:Uncharacterized protein n=1 Tax=Trichoderma longibrachiatum ATCC 18648 TaxID=983965 RepID=A0A2T4BXG2_TRILO|nr:hypothetical protein M440DRAFT_1057724 [Trichoderma longibrachiatum ATCC 18648]
MFGCVVACDVVAENLRYEASVSVWYVLMRSWRRCFGDGWICRMPPPNCQRLEMPSRIGSQVIYRGDVVSVSHIPFIHPIRPRSTSP